MASSQDIRDLAACYLAGKSSAAELANSSVLRAGLKSDDSSVKELASSVYAAVSQYLHSLVSETVLREDLEICAQDVSIRVEKDFAVDPQSTFRKKDEPLAGAVELELEYA